MPVPTLNLSGYLMLLYSLSGNDTQLANLLSQLLGLGNFVPVPLALQVGDDQDNVVSGVDFFAGQGGNDDITGTAGNDSLFGEAGDDKLYGLDGKDLLVGGTGDDDLYGGDGNDFLVGGVGADELYGEAGNDTLIDMDGVAKADGGSGNDYYRLHFKDQDGDSNPNVIGATVITDEAGSDTFELSFDSTEFELTLNTDALGGPAGNDTVVLTGNYGKADVWLGDGADTFTGGVGQDTVYGAQGNDTITTGDGNDTVYGGSGDDEINGGDGNDTLYGDETDFRAEEGTSNLVAGNDTIDGGLGDDTIYGGAGNDNLMGGDGDDTIYGGDGTDTIVGGRGYDKLYGDGPGNFLGNNGTAGAPQLITDEDGALIVEGGDGVDHIHLTYNADYSGKTVSIKGNGGADQINATFGFDGDGESSKTQSGTNFISDTSTKVTIEGGQGTDTIDASFGTSFKGEATILGEQGSETINVYLESGTANNLHKAKYTVLGGADTDTVTIKGNSSFDYFAGDIYVSGGNQNGTQTNSDTVVVNAGTNMSGNITVRTTDRFDNVDLTLGDNSSGNLTVSTWERGDNIRISEDLAYTTGFDNFSGNINIGHQGSAFSINHDIGIRIGDNLSGKVNVNLGDGNSITNGNDKIELIVGDKATASADIDLLGDMGNDLINVTVGKEFAGNLNVQGGNNNDTINVTVGDLAKASSVVTIGGGSGNDTINATFGGNNSQYDGDITVLGGDGTDTLNVDLLNGFTNQSAILVDAGNADDTVNVFVGNKFHGQLTIQGGTDAGEDTVNLTMGNGARGTTRVTTGAGADNVTVAVGTDFGGEMTVETGDGNDTIDASFGDNVLGLNSPVTGVINLDAGEGDNKVIFKADEFFAGNLDVSSGAGKDTVDLTFSYGVRPTADITVNTGAGDDFITLKDTNLNAQSEGFAGNVLINAGQGADKVELTFGRDVKADNPATLENDGADIVVNGGAGADQLTASSTDFFRGNLTLNGDEGNDFLLFTSTGGFGGNVTLDGGAGTDVLALDLDTPPAYEAGNSVTLNLNDGGSADLAYIKANDGANITIQTDDGGADLILVDANSTWGANNLQLLGGNDWFVGGAGDDSVDGGAGVDFLFGGNGWDQLLGGNGADFLFASTGDGTNNGGVDLLQGGAGEDLYFVDKTATSDVFNVRIADNGTSGENDIISITGFAGKSVTFASVNVDSDALANDLQLTFTDSNGTGTLVIEDFLTAGFDAPVIQLEGLSNATFGGAAFGDGNDLLITTEVSSLVDSGTALQLAV